MKMIYFGLHTVYRRCPTWFPYLMEVDPNFVKDFEMKERKEAKDLECGNLKA